MYVHEATLYCDDCGKELPGATWSDEDHSETDCPSHCAQCETLIDEALTKDGVNYVVDALESYTETASGRAEILDQWRDKVTAYKLDEEQGIVLARYDGVRIGESRKSS